MEIVYLLIGLVIGALAVFLIKRAEGKLAAQQVGNLEQQKTELAQQLADAQQEAKQLQQELSDANADLKSLQTQLKDEQQKNSEVAQEREQRFQQQLEKVREQFSNLATSILDNTSTKLKSQNSEAMEQITKPLKENLEQLQQAIRETNNETAKNTSSLSQQLKNMAEQTEKIDKTATRLTNVMRGSNHQQGNWGELILSEILDAQGFKKGLNYDVQQTLMDDKGNRMVNEDTGRAMRPDVILHYPSNEDVIIDSKVSIEAYAKYVNSEDEAAKKQYAQELVKSVRAQFNNLASKNYSDYVKPPRHAIDFVIMFVPNEGALQLALATDAKLWKDAFDKKVFITSQQNLMAILQIINIAWRQYTQTENQEKVFGLAEELLKRISEFYKRFENLDKDIKKLRTDYDETANKLYSGRQSITQKANDLVKLGAKVGANNRIPETQPEIITDDSGKELDDK